jgi:5'-3' exonuclease
MGVRGLKQWLQIQSPPIVPDWTCFQKTRVGIDTLPFLYNAKKQDQCIVTAIAKMVEFFRSKQIEPIFFFDGKPPSEKKEVVKERAEERTSVSNQLQILTEELVDGPDKELVEHEMKRLQRSSPTISYAERDLIKNFLYTMGVLFINASGEADPLLAYLSKTNIISAVVSTDMDMIPRGVEHLLMPIEEKWVDYTFSKILLDIHLTVSQFVNLCVLMGTDYTKGVRYISSRTAYHAIQRSGSLQEAWLGLGQKDTDLPSLHRAKELLEGSTDTIETFLREKELARWRSPPLIEPDAFRTFQRKYFPDLSVEFLQTPIAETTLDTVKN